MLDATVRERLAAEVERLRAHARDVAWVARDNLHLNLKFLGGVEADRLARIETALASAAAVSQPFELEIHELGAFPTPARARVLWAGVGAGGQAAAGLAARIDAALAPLGFPPEARAFTPHVTLGRVRAPRASPALAEALRAGVLGRQRVTAASLMRSDLSPRGARYTQLARLTLDGA
jgi:RNA 2',3'-cyclic 3'-phosphodiesterase